MYCTGCCLNPTPAYCYICMYMYVHIANHILFYLRIYLQLHIHMTNIYIEHNEGSMASCRLSDINPQWSAVVNTNHHSDKMTTTKNSLTSTKISAKMKMLVILLYSHFTQNKVPTRNPRHNLSIDH